jgi:chemotaxis protein MotB
MIEERPRKKDEPGGAWITTFADLMSLLMCFFVLLLSFAELDVMKFKAIAGSMKLAFGVQREINAIEVPKGTSIVAQEFSSGKPDPAIVDEIRQQTTEEDKQTLEFTDALVNETDGEDAQDSDAGVPEQFEQTEADAQRLVEALKQEVEEGMIQIETQNASIVIRIREKGSFPSGTAHFDPTFLQVLTKLRNSMQGVEGTIAVAGHPDDIPIKTSLYRSNWDLSSARAVSVVHALLEEGSLDAARFVVEGHGDAHPLVPNDTAQNRAQNRRVEITIRQDQPRIDSVEEVAAYPAPESGEAPASQEPGDDPAEPHEGTEERAAERPESRLDLIRKGMGGA